MTTKLYTTTIIYLLSFLGISLLIMASFWWKGLNKELKIETEFSETKILTSEVYESLLDEMLNDTTKNHHISEITKKIENHPYVKAARVSRHYPLKIKVEIIERAPVAIVNKNPMIFLDEESVVLPEIENLNNFNLPVMSNFNSDTALYPAGKKALSVKVIECISLINQIKNQYKNLYDNLSELKITSDNEIELILADRPTHIYLGNSNINSRIGILKEFENELKPNTISSFYYLDLRYENQIIANSRKS